MCIILWDICWSNAEWWHVQFGHWMMCCKKLLGYIWCSTLWNTIEVCRCTSERSHYHGAKDKSQWSHLCTWECLLSHWSSSGLSRNAGIPQFLIWVTLLVPLLFHWVYQWGFLSWGISLLLANALFLEAKAQMTLLYDQWTKQKKLFSLV